MGSEWLAAPSSDEPDYDADARQTLRVEAARRAAFHEATLAIQAVGDLEQKLAIGSPWTPAHPKYRETLAYMRHREFHDILDKVQQLVTQRLLELSKANMTGMGTSMSVHRHIKSRILLDRLQAANKHMEGPQDTGQGHTFCIEEVQRPRCQDDSSCAASALEGRSQLHLCVGIRPPAALLRSTRYHRRSLGEAA